MKIELTLGIQIQITLKNGLLEFVNWFKKHHGVK